LRGSERWYPLSAPVKTTSTAVSFSCSTCASGTPVHCAALTAPDFHCSPSTFGWSCARPLPAHSVTTESVTGASARSSARPSRPGRTTAPPISTS